MTDFAADEARAVQAAGKVHRLDALVTLWIICGIRHGRSLATLPHRAGGAHQLMRHAAGTSATVLLEERDGQVILTMADDSHTAR